VVAVTLKTPATRLVTVTPQTPTAFVVQLGAEKVRPAPVKSTTAPSAGSTPCVTIACTADPAEPAATADGVIVSWTAAGDAAT